MADGCGEHVNVLALDIGGANIKWATSSGAYGSHPFALWKAPELLVDALRVLDREHMPGRWLVTMTGELCDCFETKRAGVEHILQAVVSAASGKKDEDENGNARVVVWGCGRGAGGFVSVDDARDDPMSVSAANWHAQASVIGRRYPVGRTLLIDMGSTTTDVIPLRDGRVDAVGLTDTGRLATGELVYVGARRTALMGVVDRVVCQGQTYRVMNERFATALDVQLLLGRMNDDASNVDTADNRPATRDCAVTRMLRMIGADREMMSVDDAVAIARSFDNAMRQRVLDESVLSLGANSHDDVHRWDRIVISGSGECVLSAWFADLGLDANSAQRLSVERLGDMVGPQATEAACAWALLQLDQEKED